MVLSAQTDSIKVYASHLMPNWIRDSDKGKISKNDPVYIKNFDILFITDFFASILNF